MKSLNNLMKFFFLLIFSFSISAIAGEKEVKDAVNKYMDGVSKKNSSALEEVIYENANFVAINKIINKQDDMDRDTYVKFVKAGRIGGWGKDIVIKSVNAQETIATAYIEITNSKLIQKEFVTLLKIEGTWKISNSAYSIAKK